MFTATLIASGTLTAGDISTAMDRLRDAGCAPGASGWIDEGDAADLIFGMAPDAARGALEGAFAATDVVVQSSLTRTKTLLVADMDLDDDHRRMHRRTRRLCWDQAADRRDHRTRDARRTRFRGGAGCAGGTAKGLAESDIERCLAERVTIMPGAKALVRTMRSRGALAVLVSGGFTRFAEPVAKEIGFDRAIANVLKIDGGVLTGTVTKPIVASNTKLTTLRAAIAERGIVVEESLAVGDGANDLAMIEAAGLGVAYHAKPIVAAAAAARIDHRDLTALLYAQGIPKRDWVAE
ncbi:HAD-IB family phosphatase [Sphingomonas sp. LR55]|uniref:HAD-IB family phosphatase n=1 Tax=Sphingomonas sp. LR55 TaxID=3050231 RepID=UPI002FDF873B